MNLSLAITICLGMLQLVVPRRYALLPIVVAGCYMTAGWVLDLGALNFYLTRVIVLVALARVAVRREFLGFRWSPSDSVLVAWLMIVTFAYVIFDGTNVSLITRLGYAFDAAGTYMLARVYIRSVEDARRLIIFLAVATVPLSVLLAREMMTGRNPFFILGGVGEFSEVRDGRVRAQGPFPHSILAGTFGGALFPLYVGLWLYERRSRLVAALGMTGALVIMYASASSGPLMAFAIGIVGLGCWFLRAYMRQIRWGILLALVTLALIMRRPIWFLIAKISEMSGHGSGWYRSALIDSAYNNLSQWWLVGTTYTRHWMPTGIAADSDSADIVNEFLAQGVRGGLLAMVLYIWLIVRCFKVIGRAVRNEASNTLQVRLLMWTVGCSLLSFVASFFSVSLFGQMINFWMLFLGLIIGLSGLAPVLARKVDKTREANPRKRNRTSQSGTKSVVGDGRSKLRIPVLESQER